MAVYTEIDNPTLLELLSHYAVGKLQEFAPITAGTINSNYLVTADQQYILTIFEQDKSDDLKYYFDLMTALADQGLPCPKPFITKDAEHCLYIKNKPAALIEFMPGASVAAVNEAQCRAVGEMLGRFHKAEFAQRKENPFGLAFVAKFSRELSSQLADDDAKLLKDELKFQLAQDYSFLPQGTIHADLFRDNVLFSDDEITGLLDFYIACDDCYLYDLAVVLNDWSEWGDSHHHAILDSYQQQRALTELEQELLPNVARWAIIRFWIMRLERRINPPEGMALNLKNPDELKAKLLNLRGVSG